MTLATAIRCIEKAAAVQPPVSTIVRQDIFRLNARPDVAYGVVAWLQGEHATSAESSLTAWAFTLFYVDRLTEGSGNEVEVQSTGIEVLENIIRRLSELGLYATDYTFQAFTQRFVDDCAGVFCRVTLEAAKDTLCGEAWEWVDAPGAFPVSWDEEAKAWRWDNTDRTVLIF